MNNSPMDVPSPIDLRKMDDAREWADKAMERRPWREEFFSTITRELSRENVGELTVLELGSGPGFLAKRILESSPCVTYVALDFSLSMHMLAKQRLGALVNRVQFLEADFRDSDWNTGLTMFDAIVSVQAVHELRHKQHAPSFYQKVLSVLRNRGVFLVCDHFCGQGGMSDMSLYMTFEEHEWALRSGGFSGVEMLLEKGGLALFRATP
jgi:SAM-dependent methyltransferase